MFTYTKENSKFCKENSKSSWLVMWHPTQQVVITRQMEFWREGEFSERNRLDEVPRERVGKGQSWLAELTWGVTQCGQRHSLGFSHGLQENRELYMSTRQQAYMHACLSLCSWLWVWHRGPLHVFLGFTVGMRYNLEVSSHCDGNETKMGFVSENHTEYHNSGSMVEDVWWFPQSVKVIKLWLPTHAQWEQLTVPQSLWMSDLQ